MVQKRLTIYPVETAVLICGGNTPACNRAIECWAHVLRDSMPDLTRTEWSYLADVLNGASLFDAAEHWSPQCIALEVHDGHELNRLGDKWFVEESPEDLGRRVRGERNPAADAAVKNLIAKIATWSYAQAQYVVTAVEFFWGDGGRREIDIYTAEWWTIPFRVQWLRGAAALAGSPAAD